MAAFQRIIFLCLSLVSCLCPLLRLCWDRGFVFVPPVFHCLQIEEFSSSPVCLSLFSPLSPLCLLFVSSLSAAAALGRRIFFLFHLSSLPWLCWALLLPASLFVCFGSTLVYFLGDIGLIMVLFCVDMRRNLRLRNKPLVCFSACCCLSV